MRVARRSVAVAPLVRGEVVAVRRPVAKSVGLSYRYRFAAYRASAGRVGRVAALSGLAGRHPAATRDGTAVAKVVGRVRDARPKFALP